MPEKRMAILANAAQADGVVIEASTDAKLILVAGKPLKEPIVQYGPFVMNSQEEIYKALSVDSSAKLSQCRCLQAMTDPSLPFRSWVARLASCSCALVALSVGNSSLTVVEARAYWDTYGCAKRSSLQRT